VTALLGLATRLRLARLLLITDLRRPTVPPVDDRFAAEPSDGDQLAADHPADLTGFVAATVAAGADIVLLREDGAPALALMDGLFDLRAALTGEHRVILGLAEPVAATQGEADLVHLPAGCVDTPDEVRPLLHQWALVGRSCHDVAGLEAALAGERVDYLTVGPVSGAAGLDLVRRAAELLPPGDPASLPWFATGGVTPATLDAVVAAGARRIGVARCVRDAADPAVLTRELAQRLARAWREDPGMERVSLSAFGSGGPGLSGLRPRG
jgi:thiamine-phosphate pyrophosphorylase